MSDTTTVPQGTDPLAAPNGAPPPAPQVTAPPAVPKVDMTPAQLKERLDEERTKAERRAAEQFAKDLGVPVDEAKRVIAEAKAKDEAAKSEVQRLTEANAAKDTKLARLSVLEETIAARAAVEYGALNEAQRQAIDTLAGTDPAARLKAIDAMKPTWAQAQADATKAAQEAAAKAAAEAEKAKANQPPPPVPPGANTTPPVTPPPAINPGTPTNHLAVYESLKSSNPAAAAVYHNKHAAAILAARRNKS